MAGNWNDIGRETRRSSAIHRIGRNVAWELLSKPRPMDLSSVPPSPDCLTPEYLTAVLCKGVPDARVTSIKLGARSSGSADRCAFKVTYNAAGDRAALPKDLFMKSTEGFYTRLHLLRCGLRENEANFYNIIAAELDIEVPKLYHAAFDKRSDRLAIILQDVVAVHGAKFFEIDTPLVRSDIEQMLAILADLHAKYWNSPRLDSEFTWLMTPAQYSVKLIEGMEFEAIAAAGEDRAANVLPASLKGRKADVWAAFLKSMEVSSRSPRTYVCGDPHLRNFYKLNTGRVGFADWQVTMKGAWSFDFTYTLLTALSIEQRRAWDKDLLAFYLARVKARGGNPPSVAEAWELYRRQTLYTYVGWLATIGFGALQPSMQPDSASLEIIKRSAHAMEDLGSMAALKE